VFWRRDRGTAANAYAVYTALMEGHFVDGLLDLPVEQIVAEVLARFPGAARVGDGPLSEGAEWVSGDRRSSFRVEWSPKHVLVEVRNVSNDVGNLLVDIVTGFGCPLYDPQVNERFDSQFDC